jgi:hypothetical protein
MKKQVVILIGSIIGLLVILLVVALASPRTPQQVLVQAPVIPNRILTAPVREPEFRGPPIREYKPNTYKQVGLMMGENNDMFPIYGRPSYAYNNRWNYYTTTQGEQVYPLPISNGNRDCTEDIGCDELYGNENLSILGKNGTYKTTIYRVSPEVGL